MRVQTRRGLQLDSTTSSASWKHTRITPMYLSVYGMFWWTWSGSNRRPLPCHLRNISHLRTVPPETEDLAKGDVDAGGRHGTTSGRLDSTRTEVGPGERS